MEKEAETMFLAGMVDEICLQYVLNRVKITLEEGCNNET